MGRQMHSIRFSAVEWVAGRIDERTGILRAFPDHFRRHRGRYTGRVKTVALSGKPSVKRSVPRRVSTWSGVVIDGGVAVVIFIGAGEDGTVCAPVDVTERDSIQTNIAAFGSVRTRTSFFHAPLNVNEDMWPLVPRKEAKTASNRWKPAKAAPQLEDGPESPPRAWMRRAEASPS